MNTFITFLRGINVSGQKKVPMAELRNLFTKEGFQNVETYIQSGNVVFQSDSSDEQKLEDKIKSAIQSHFGFDVSVLVKSPEELQQIFDDCPFSQNQKEQSYFILLYNIPDKGLIKELSNLEFPDETFVITKNCIYLYVSNGYGRAKCNNNFFERKLKVTATARNYKTIVKLLSLSADKS